MRAKLPTLEFIAIHNYQLFNDWSREFMDGLNLFLGINAMGKTTTIKLLVYAFIGDHTDGDNKKINSSFFLERLDDPKDNKASVEIRFKIDDVEFHLIRSLKDGLKSLQIDGEEQESDNLQQTYEELFTKHANFNFISLRDLLENLLVREEEGTYLLWNQEKQSQILRLLTLDMKLEADFEQIKKELQEADSNYKRKKDQSAQFKNRKDTILESQREQEDNQKTTLSVDSLRAELNKLSKRREELHNSRTKLELERVDLSENLSASNNSLSSISARISDLEGQYKARRYEKYQAAFTSADYKLEMVQEKLNGFNHCEICNSKLSEKEARKALEKLSSENCPLCESDLAVKGVVTNTIESKELDKLQDKVGTLKQEMVSIQERFNKDQNRLSELIDLIQNHDVEIRELSIQILDRKSILEKIIQEGKSQVNEVDVLIASLDAQKKNIDEVAAQLLEKHKEVVKKADKLNKKVNKLIKQNEKRLREIFTEYCSIYFEESVDLFNRDDKNSPGLEIPLSYFLPVLNNKTRFYRQRVSTSEANILEYIFRISLLKLYHENSEIQPFFLLETSEGSFDLDKTIKLADTIRTFGENNFPQVIVTNLSKVDFIEQLLPNNRVERTFLILDFARDSHKAPGLIEKHIRQLGLRHS